MVLVNHIHPQGKEGKMSYTVTLEVQGGKNGVLLGRMFDDKGHMLAGGVNIPVSGLRGITTKQDSTEVTGFPFTKFTVSVAGEDMKDPDTDPFVRNKLHRAKGISDEAVFRMLQRKLALEEGLAKLKKLEGVEVTEEMQAAAQKAHQEAKARRSASASARMKKS